MTPEQIARHRSLVQRFDKNGDGRLDASEIRAMARELQPKTNHGPTLAELQKFDLNGDGIITFEERVQVTRIESLQRANQARTAALLALLGPVALARYDTNKNGVLDPSEYDRFQQDFKNFTDARFKRILAKYDLNKNGKLDPDETKAYHADYANGVFSLKEFLQSETRTNSEK